VNIFDKLDFIRKLHREKEPVFDYSGEEIDELIDNTNEALTMMDT
jgi:hypothetical protein